MPREMDFGTTYGFSAKERLFKETLQVMRRVLFLICDCTLVYPLPPAPDLYEILETMQMSWVTIRHSRKC